MNSLPVLCYLLNRSLQCLACLEHGNFAGGDIHGLFCPGIMDGMGGAHLCLKGTKAHQLNLLPCLEGVCDGFCYCSQRGLTVLLGQTGFLGHSGYQFHFVHVQNILSKSFPGHCNLFTAKTQDMIHAYSIFYWKFYKSC